MASYNRDRWSTDQLGSDNQLTVWDVWPKSHRKLTQSTLRSLPESDFHVLCRLVRERALNSGLTAGKAHQLVRSLHRRRYGHREAAYSKERQRPMLLATFRTNLVLDSFFPDRKSKWIAPVHRTEEREFSLHPFSFVDDPKGSMAVLRNIAEAEAIVRTARADFEDNYVLDIAPYVVWGLMSRDMAPFMIGGTMPIPIKKVIEAVGLRRFMNMKKFPGLADQKDVWAFPLKQRYAAGTTTAEPKDSLAIGLTADELVDTVNHWLGALPFPLELTTDAMSKLSRIVTEMLDNAERHGRSGGDGDWYLAGFMAKRDNRFECHLAFVNLGITISDAIRSTPHEQTRLDLDEYARRHSRLIEGSQRQGRDTLATLYAMQDGVSSLPEAMGGQGMMDMVEFTNDLGYHAEDVRWPAITIVSGKSCLQFNGKYRDCRYADSEKRIRIQPFNPEGRLDHPPSRDHVYDLDDSFPGTVIAIRFSLDHHKFLEGLEDEDDRPE